MSSPNQIKKKYLAPEVVSYFDNQIDAVESQLAQEALDRQSGDQSFLNEAKAYADQKITDLVGGAPEMLDTLKEISDALGSDANLASTLSAQISGIQSGLSQEISDRQSGDSSTLSSANAYTDSKHNEQKSYLDAADALKVAKAGDTMTGKLSVLPSSGETAFETYKQTTAQPFGTVAREKAIAGIYSGWYVVNDPAPVTNGSLNMTTSGNVYLNETVSDANFKGSVWRIDNGKNEAIPVTVQSYNNPAFSISFTAPAYSRIFVISPVRVTHSMTSSYGVVSKSANFNIFGWSGLYGSAEMLSKTEVKSGNIKLTGLSGAPSMPSAGEDVAVKKYVDDQDASKLIEAKSYADAQVLVEKTRAEGAEAGLQSQITTEKGRVDAILSASEADKDSFAEIVALINSVDLENDQAFAGAMLAEQNAREAGDTALGGRITDLEGVVQGNFDLQQSDIEGLRSDVDANSSAISQESSDRASADSALDARIVALETAPPAMVPHKMSPITVSASELVSIDCDHEAKAMSLHVFVGRLAVHEGVD